MIYLFIFIFNEFFQPGDLCTSPSSYGCERTGNGGNIINPISSARLRSANSFAFTYGKVEARAKLPLGDWLWPAIWMLPLKQEYGLWPTSGEIDIMESRGNLNLVKDGTNIGVEQVQVVLYTTELIILRMLHFFALTVKLQKNV